MAAAAPLEHDMRSRLVSVLASVLVLSGPANAAVNVLIVEGLGGEDRYTAAFDAQVGAIRDAAATVASEDRIRTLRVDEVSRAAFVDYFDALAANLDEEDQVLIYLIGHGSFDDHEYKFNIPGPDITAADVAAALDKLPTSNLVLVNTSSASGAAIDDWKNEQRVVITATRSGVERHATKFGAHFTAALEDPGADIDKNNIISAQEAFDFAERGVADYFDERGQLATEHPQIEGERAGRFSLARLVEDRAQQDDARLSELIASRDVIAARIDELRLSRDEMDDDEYQRELLENMLELATAEEAIEQREQELARGQ
jgi:hypothetical protein